MFGRPVRRSLLLLATIAITALLMKGFGLLQYVPGVGGFVYGTANALKISGDEDVENFYFLVTGVMSLLGALLAVWLMHRWWRRRSRSGTYR